ncbi:SDR family oxidoreductase [Tenuifilum thalassicum]|uniref:SDR family oxidoreductase n=1 Tax=Tenuifilum thalassicum TaxID=2590900 RepID=A0A7D4BSE4_9BACT|nr:SDR family oxidoreductase [Tenuifilum thalassicum]QKG80341.1 SDR family oxidoreductase [Tenuifilum thalassicum]
MVSFKNRLVWITGASSGIGRELALLLAEEGAHLILSSNDPKELSKVADECREFTSFCQEYPFDLSKPEEVNSTAETVVNTFGNIYLLINNGGISQRSLVKDTPVEIDRRIMEIDYFSYVILTKAVLPGMIEAGEGFIAATSSISGKFGFPLRSAYAAAKHAIQGFFETLRAEAKPHNISVTIAYPGRIQTNISLHAIDSKGNKHGVMDPGQQNGMPARECAKRYIRAIKKRKPEVYIGKSEILMVHIKRLFPRLFFRIVTKIKPT